MFGQEFPPPPRFFRLSGTLQGCGLRSMKYPMTSPLRVGFLEMFREFASLDKRRATLGVTPLEFQRWSHLNGRLREKFEQRGVPKSVKSRSTRLRLEFRTPVDFVAAQLPGLASGEGMFINTAFAVEVGEKFLACVLIASTGQELELPCIVVSANTGGEHSTMSLGMGVRFSGVPESELAKLRLLWPAAAADCQGAEVAEEAESTG